MLSLLHRNIKQYKVEPLNKGILPIPNTNSRSGLPPLPSALMK